MLPYDSLTLKKYFNHRTFSRGQHYQKQKRVKALTINSEKNIITARVIGSDDDPYTVEIELISNKNNQTEFHGDCSCPVGYNCKHTVATLLEALSQNFSLQKQVNFSALSIPQTNRAVLSWLTQIKQTCAASPIVAKKTDESYQVLYVLKIQKRGDYLTTYVECCLVRKLKKGGYGKSQRLNLTSYARQRYVTKEAQDILIALEIARKRRDNTFYYYSSEAQFELQNEEDSVLLEKIIATGHCYWQNTSTAALTLGEKKSARLNWTIDEEGLQHVVCYVDDKPMAVLPLSIPWYVDDVEMRCGFLATTVQPTLFRALLSAPPITVNDLAVTREHLQKLNNLADIPLPHTFADAQVKQIKPTPRLRLFTAQIDYDFRYYRTDYPSEAALAELSFHYSEAQVLWYENKNPLHRWQNSQLVTYLRNAAAENNALAELSKRRLVIVQDILNNSKNSYNQCFLLTSQHMDPITFSTDHIPALKQLGWQVEFAADYPYCVLNIDDAPWYSQIDEGTGFAWFDLELGIEVEGERINLLPLLHQLLNPNIDTKSHANTFGNPNKPTECYLVPLKDGRLVRIPHERVQTILQILTELYDQDPLTDQAKLRLSRSQVGRLTELDDHISLRWLGGEKLRQLAVKLKDFSGIATVPVPNSFKADLRPYQQTGFNWLQFLREYELAGILADDMGLGKTIQALAHIAMEKVSGRMDKPCLVIGPTSLMFNWHMEAQRFTPDLKVLILQGQLRKKFFPEIHNYDIILTTYPLLPRDQEFLLKQQFYLLILDEAQAIKNPRNQAAEIVQQISAQYRLCLTGTPIENHLGELWSLFHFLLPGFLGDMKQFQRLYRMPIERQQNQERRTKLTQRIAPFILRRTKDQILKELPPKIETLHYVELQGEVRDLYETIRISMQEKLSQQIAKMGFARSHIMILDALLKLRQICCDHRLLKKEIAKNIKQKSAKLVLLMDLLRELLQEGRKVLLFSQFTEMLVLIEQELIAEKMDYLILTGQTQDRATPVQQFQQGKANLFLISLKAGGTGLNLTAADTVIHYDPWWNPAVENQATDRAHRIGQEKTVFVYKLVAKDTVEEKILALQQHKKALVEKILSEKFTERTQFTQAELENLFAPLE